ncbi:immunity 52 family protein [Methylocella silvestris]|nr:immunity 52 family protein [Methylocella silvestris]
MRANSPEYYIHAGWGPRAETPDVIAARFLTCIDRLKEIHPAYDQWIFALNNKPKKFKALRDDLPAAVAANVARAEDGAPTPIYGYRPRVLNNMGKAHSRSLSVKATAGSWATSGHFVNSAQIGTARAIAPDPTIIAYPVFKAALLALAESFDATYCAAYPMQLRYFGDRTKKLRLAWMHYMAPRFAPLITPPPSAIVERTARGALLLSATDETFRIENPEHMAAAEDILKALAPFEALPWPPDAQPK